MNELKLIEHLFDNYYHPLHVESFEKGEAHMLEDLKNGANKSEVLSAISNLLNTENFSWIELMKKCELDDYFCVFAEEQARKFVENYLIPRISGENVSFYNWNK